MRQALRRAGRFWLDFVVGDDWRLAAAVAAGLVATAALAAAGLPAWWPLPLAAVTSTRSTTVPGAAARSVVPQGARGSTHPGPSTRQ